MSIEFTKKNEDVWCATTYHGLYKCICTGDKWAVFFNDNLVASKLKGLFESHDFAMKHNTTADDIIQDVSTNPSDYKH
jgi:hypothetical protein